MFEARTATITAKHAARDVDWESATISHTTASAAIRHRRALECELGRARRSKDVRRVAELAAELRRLEEWLTHGAA